ncbi:MAG: TonB-dependent receptor, partial [Ekhidna sp.]|nr:TonB-dependent receptor [Ekhidna sp.]
LIPSQAFQVDFSVMESNLSINFDYYKSERLNYYFGVDSKFHQVNPGTRRPIGAESLILDEQVGRERAIEFNPYFSAKYQLSDRLLLDFGARYNVYNALGPGKINLYQDGAPISEASRIGEVSFGDNEVIAAYHGPELRVSSRYLLGESSSIKAGYNRTRQNHHLLLNAASISPTDIWRISGRFIKPQIGDQISVGYFKNLFGKNFIEISGELYYKRIRNLLDFRTGAELQFNNAVETDLLQGDGQSYGFELSLKKPDGWLNGWLNYTYSRSLIRLDSQFPENRVNGGNYFPTGYDRPHYLNAVLNYKFTNRITITTSTVFTSGIPVTYPEGKWFFQGAENILYSNRNEYRIPNYFRLDLGFNIDASYKLKKWTHSSWTFSVYNVLGRDNVYTIFFRVDDGEINGYEMTVFEDPIPTITYNFKF